MNFHITLANGLMIDHSAGLFSFWTLSVIDD